MLKITWQKIIHCNADWRKSGFNNLDFLTEYNEFNINNFAFSFDTKTQYVHYVFPLPPVKSSGNYLLKVYREGNEKDIVLTRRFSVFDTRVAIGLFPDGNRAATTRRRQQVAFDVNYQNLELINPMQNVRIVIKQNFRWDNAITGLRPTSINEFDKKLSYRFFNDENTFLGGNEYRFFDLRSLRFPGQNIHALNTNQQPIQGFVMTDRPRIYQAYSQYNDFNGNYIINNQDVRGNPNEASDYINMQFSLESNVVGGEVYVFGALTDWGLKPEARLRYDSITEKYKTNLLLKQGWYDYQYYVKSDTIKSNYFEGNHFETENEYEVYVYYRPMSMRGDLLVGYVNFNQNSRRQ